MSLRAPPFQLGLDGGSNELGALVGAHERVNALKHGPRKPHGRADDTETRTPHARGTRRYRFFGQRLHFSAIAYLTALTDGGYISAIGYGDKQMTEFLAEYLPTAIVVGGIHAMILGQLYRRVR